MRLSFRLVPLFLIFTLTAGPLLAQEETSRVKRGAVIGTIVGLAGGGLAAAILVGKQHCSGGWYDTKKEEVARCYVAPAALIAGGGMLGYFAGRAADRRSPETLLARSRRAQTLEAAALPPPVKLRPPLTPPLHPAFRVLFTQRDSAASLRRQ